jgi:hypothetical protein
MRETKVTRCIDGKRVTYERKVTPKVRAVARSHLKKALRVWKHEYPTERARAHQAGFHKVHNRWLKIKVAPKPCKK